MKTCPRCNKTYPGTENFCEDDSSALISAPAFTQVGEPARVECPVCGGKAEPGEVICNFCGARLDQAQASAPSTVQPAKVSSPSSPYPRIGGATQATPPVSGHAATPVTGQAATPVTGRIPDGHDEGGRSIIGTAGYIVAAIVALVAGAWFAIHLSSQKPAEETAATAPPSAISSPAVETGPIVVLANAMPVQVSGPGSTAPGRSADAIRKAFEDNRGSLVDAYNHVLSSDPKAADGMLMRLRIRTDGTMETSAVRTSTNPHPSLDARVAAATSSWKLPATSAGDVEADFAIVFAHDNGEVARLESELQTKLANLSPTETPEYASVPEPESTAAAASSAASAAMPSPGAAGAPSPAPIASAPAMPAPAIAQPRRRPRREVAALPPPTAPSLLQQVQERLKSNPKLRRVKAYTAGSTVTLYGKVFDDGDKSLAEETVRSLPGVTSVIDTVRTDEAEWSDQQNRIAREFANSGLDKVTVKVIGHDAFLNGQVKTPLEKDRAVTVAEGAAPVTVRENLIRVEPGNVFGF